jgi:hypothetical protein
MSAAPGIAIGRAPRALDDVERTISERHGPGQWSPSTVSKAQGRAFPDGARRPRTADGAAP